jgi:glycosyltransferase involved in cell wall biosynthesis
MKYAVVIPARNEEKHIEKTLSALRKQTVLPSQIILVDDGSNDRTGQIASKYADVVVQLPDRGYNVVGTPELSTVINQGLKRVEKDVDYVLICGADDILPEDYVEAILSKMKANPKLVMASGIGEGKPYAEYSPRGAGRVVDAKFWKEVNNLQYPVVWGWEDWPIFKALQLGYETRSFPDVVTQPQRPMLSHARAWKARLWGKAMYALGYDWKYALGRCALTFFKSPKAGVNMFLGWLLHKNIRRLDIADWVNQWQKNLFWKRVRTIIKRGGRK